MVELIYCELSQGLIGYRTADRTVFFEWCDGKAFIPK